MPKKMHIDIETYSSIDIGSSGVYRYVESIDFEILIICYAYDDEEVITLDLAQGDKIPQSFINNLLHPNVTKLAHNANFERTCFRAYGFNVPIDQWQCTAVLSAQCGLPLSLAKVSEALELKENGKKAEGLALIRFFSIPIKPTNANGNKHRNLPKDDLEKWEAYKDYCKYDVIAEREIAKSLSRYELTLFEQVNYIIDQEINDRGIMVDTEMAQVLYDLDNRNKASLIEELKEITELDNPNSPAQLKRWLSEATGKDINSLAKDKLGKIAEESGSDIVKHVIDLRRRTSKTSTKKYAAMLNCLCSDNRVHGLFQFYGANRTGRWAGRLVQLQNLTKNNLSDLELAREVFKSGDFELINMLYDNISSTISQLIRTAFIAKDGHHFDVADFSAIEARVVAWLANEKWRLEVFAGHGKIYEASASRMFNVPIEEVTKGSDLRSKGKNAELALGYQGAVGAMIRLGADKMGMSETEMAAIVKKWRKANPAIVKLWYDCEKYMKRAYNTKSLVKTQYRGLAFSYDGRILQTHLPSGRRLSYYSPRMRTNRFGSLAIQYLGIDQVTKKWDYIDTYGGKIVENIIQAISRDALAYSMQRLHHEGFDITMHVHDEIICENPIGHEKYNLKTMCEIMDEDVPWAPGLILRAEGYTTPFYKKD